MQNAGNATQLAAPAKIASLSLTELCDHIEATHHAYLRRELPVLWRQVHTVRDVHGAASPHLETLTQVFEGFVAEIESHMHKEEQILFPMIRKLDQGGGPQSFHCGSVANPIRVMVMEHDQAGAALQRMRTLTNGFEPPACACTTYRAMLVGLASLERDMRVHVDTENEILFPRAVRHEAA